MTPPPLISGHRGHRGTNQKANDQVIKNANFEQILRFLPLFNSKTAKNRYSY